MICKLKNIEPLVMSFNIQKKSKEFLEVNSTGKVPVLVHQVSEEEALVLDDPLLIAKYLEELYPNPPIRSKSKENFGRWASVRGWNYGCQRDTGMAVYDRFYTAKIDEDYTVVYLKETDALAEYENAESAINYADEVLLVENETGTVSSITYEGVPRISPDDFLNAEIFKKSGENVFFLPKSNSD